MSLSQILDPNTSDQTWKALEVYSIHSETGFDTSGNIVVANSNPSVSVLDTAVNTNRATLALQGGPGLGMVKLQQDNVGNAFLQNLNTNSSISLIPNGTGVVIVQGPATGVGSQALLRLKNSGGIGGFNLIQVDSTGNAVVQNTALGGTINVETLGGSVNLRPTGAGDLNLTPFGTGEVNIATFAGSNADISITPDGTGQSLVTNLVVNPGGSLLNWYQEYSFSLVWSGPLALAGTAKGIRVGKLVTLTIPTSQTAGNNTSANMISQAGAVPSDLRPTSTLNYACSIINGPNPGSLETGDFQINSSGTLVVTNEVHAAFTAATVVIGLFGFSLSYTIN